MIFSFSGCGNSKYIANVLSKKLNEKFFDVNEAIKNNLDPIQVTDELCIITFPVYFGRMPKILIDFLNKCKFENSKLYFVGTYFDKPFGCEVFNRKWCLKNKLNYQGSLFIKMPQVHATFGKPSSEEEAKKIIEESLKFLDSKIEFFIQKKFLPNEKYKSKIVSYLVNPIFQKVIEKNNSKKFNIDETKCIGCGTCVEYCFLNNIILENGKAKFKNLRCIHCNSCINICPNRAINYKKKTQNLNRYYNKEVI